MTRLLVLFTLSVPLLTTGQQPVVEHATVETRAVTTLARDIASAGAGPAWLAWQVPMVAGERDLCSTWRDDQTFVRGTMLEGTPSGTTPAFAAPASRTVALEAGTTLLVLARVVAGSIERLRMASDDCPLDAGGRTLVWLSGVTPAASLAFLDTLTSGSTTGTNQAQSIARAAVGAIALHADASADAILTRLLASTSDSSLRSQAASWLGRARGPAGADRLIAMLKTETDRGFRRTLVSSLSQSREPRVIPVLGELARTDTDATVRGEAVYWYTQLSGPSVMRDVLQWTEAEKDEAVQRRALSSISRLPDHAGVAPLIALARATTNVALRKNAIRVLSETSDPAATAYMRELLQ